MGNTTSSLNLFASCLPQHPAAEQQQQKSSFNPTPVDDDQAKTDDWDSDFSDHFDEQKKETKSETKDSLTSNGQTFTNHAPPTEKVVNAPMRLEKKDKDVSLKLTKEKEPVNPTLEPTDKLTELPLQPHSPKASTATISPKQAHHQTSSPNQEANNSNTTESQDVDFFSDMTPQYVAPKKIQIQPKPQPLAQHQAAKIKIDLETANKPENLDAVGWDEEEIQIEDPNDVSSTSTMESKRDRKKKVQPKEQKQKTARLTAVKLKSNEAFNDDFEDESNQADTNS